MSRASGIARWGSVLVLLCVLLVPGVVFAQSIIPGCDPLPGKEESCGVEHIFNILVALYNRALGLAGIVALLFLIWGGIQMFVYHLQEQPQQKLESAKYTVTRAIGGLIIIALAYVVVFTLLTWLGVGNPREYLDGSIFRQP